MIVALTDAARQEDDLIGGKARTLGRLLQAGYRVPDGFCITVEAYQRFVDAAGLAKTIQMELGRKPLSGMRWEEIWDAALRIRSAFLAAPFPSEVADAIQRAHQGLASGSLAVRSSAPGEDSAARSYAGLHESLVGVDTPDALLDAVRIVWASLWSDAALLYRKELDLDASHSRMAVVVQEFVAAAVSGVGFGIDPTRPAADRAVVEAVPGRCEGLVSGAVDPDRWILKRSSGEIVEWTPGDREVASPTPILEREDLELLHRTLRGVETFLGCPPDVEWTGRASQLTLLQARPVTSATDQDDERSWYLTLRPGAERLRALCARVSDELIPQLADEAGRFAAEDLEHLSDTELADAIEARQESHERWKTIYKQDFIPFAHGVRHFGVYYNDTLRPDDPYEFVMLLENQKMLMSQRNAALRRLASIVRRHDGLAAALASLSRSGGAESRDAWRASSRDLCATPGWDAFCRELETFLDQHMNMTFEEESLDQRPDLTLDVVLQLAADPARAVAVDRAPHTELEERFLAAVGADRREEAQEVLRVARLSWQLRDDDNILMGRLQNQLQRALAHGGERLAAQGRLLPGTRISETSASRIVTALRDPAGGAVQLPGAAARPPETRSASAGETPRQLIGQPAARGLATGAACVVREAADFRRFRQGNVMVCDSIQPTMTHLVTLASAIVERRGGMLIHGAIIARELGVPCVNGVTDATRVLHDGDLVTVDGNLGIVTVGPPDFDLEQET